MRKIPFFFVPLSLALAGCASAKFKQQRAQLAQCESRSQELSGQVKEGETWIAALQTQARDLEAQVADLNGKLASQQERIDSMAKSNTDLTSAIEAGKGESSTKIAEIVKEKDSLARRVAAMQKDKIALERARSNLKAGREKIAEELAALKTAHEGLLAQGEKTAEERRLRLGQAREDLGSVADAILKEIQGEKARIAQNGDSVAVTLQEPLLFKPQQAKLTEAGTALLDRLGRALQALGPRSIKIDGHCDNAAMKWEPFGSISSRWELSSLRATAVARYLHEHSGLDPRRLVASGFGEFRPVKGNDTPEGREANSRIVLTVDQAAP